MSKSTQKSNHSRTTYKPDRHPRFTAAQNVAISANQAIQDLTIAIEVMPPINLAELRSKYEAALREPLPLIQDMDQTVWKHALVTEIARCTPKPAHMRRALEHPKHPTQHAKIDASDPSQFKQLEGILKPETLRRTFISIPALMAQIQTDIGEYLQK
jgi:hypothetical protein